jgi:hypothetical protein
MKQLLALTLLTASIYAAQAPATTAAAATTAAESEPRQWNEPETLNRLLEDVKQDTKERFPKLFHYYLEDLPTYDNNCDITEEMLLGEYYRFIMRHIKPKDKKTVRQSAILKSGGLEFVVKYPPLHKITTDWEIMTDNAKSENAFDYYSLMQEIRIYGTIPIDSLTCRYLTQSFIQRLDLSKAILTEDQKKQFHDAWVRRTLLFPTGRNLKNLIFKDDTAASTNTTNTAQ